MPAVAGCGGNFVYGITTLSVLVVQSCWICCAEIIINEINSDNPSEDNREFVELWNADSCQRSLDGYTLVLFNGFTNPPVAYKTVDLSGYCMEQAGYFLIGSPNVTPAPDIVRFGVHSVQQGIGEADAVAIYKNYFENGFILIGSSSLNPRPNIIISDGIQNGNKEADAVALYNNYVVPTIITDLHLVDLVIYDKDLVTSIANYPSNPLYQQIPVHEDEEYLPGDDESINRCQLPAFNHSSFSIGEITPGAANVCQPPGSGLEDCYDVSARTNLRFTISSKSKVNSPYFKSQTVRSSSECAKQCSQIQACALFSFNVKNTTSDNCFFFLPCDNAIIGDMDWHVGTRL